MLSAQANYHLANKDNATVEFVNNMLQNEASNYLTNMSSLSHGLTKMCSSLTAHWPPTLNGHQQQLAQNQLPMSQSSAAAAAAAAAALAAGHNIESILGGSYSVKIDNSDKLSNHNHLHKTNNLLSSNTNNASNNFNLNGNISSNNSIYSSINNSIKQEHGNKNSDFNNSYDAGMY